MGSRLQQLKKAVIYCRVSTKEQVEEGNSLASQERHCREYSIKHGYEVIATFIEQGESAKTIDRTELKKLIAFCSSKKNKVSAVIAYKIDRISRNTEDYSYIKILLRRNGVQIKSTSENFDNTPAGKFMENIIANVSQFDNDVRAERCAGGMKDAVHEGRYVWMAPYGYSNVRVNGKATIAPNEHAKFVRKAFEEIALEQFPASEVRKKLIIEGMITSAGKPISKSRFYSILRDELYTGWINKFNERNKGLFEPIVSEELFAFVQRVLSGKKYIKTQFLKQNPDFPLRKFFSLPNGRLLTGAWSNGRTKRYAYYTFHNANINIRKEVLESVFISWLNTYFKLDVDYFDSLKQLVKSYSQQGLDNTKSTIQEILKTIELLKTKQKLILNKNIDGVISNELAQEEIALLDTEIYALQQRLMNRQVPEINELKLLEIIKDVLLHPGKIWQQADIETKIKLQWFYFPNGITFAKAESRTSKICKLFKLKTLVSPLQSFNVHYPNSKSNTLNWQNLVFDCREETDITTPESFEEIKTALFDLATILHPELNATEFPYALAA